MSLRGRLALAAALAVAIAALLASGAAYLVVRHELRAQVDATLKRRASLLDGLPPSVILGVRLLTKSLEGTYVQVIDEHGKVQRLPIVGGSAFPVSQGAAEVAAGKRDGFYGDVRFEETHLRVLTVPLSRGGLAVQVARPLTEVDRTLRRVAFILLAVAGSGVGLAAVLGLLVARVTLRPVQRLTEAVEHVRQTRDLSQRIESERQDELGRLAASFDEMLEALEASMAAQRQLVADASHELRTPLTSLRTNLEVLSRGDPLATADRERLLADVVRQLEELTELVDDLVELARGAEPEEALEDVRLDLLVERAVARAHVHSPGIRFEARLTPTLVRASPGRLDRAVANLLDNAGKWSPDGGVVEVSVADGEVAVRDHGPGIDASDLPLVFDRFYRSPAARSMPGSGLGLAIVRQVAEALGGTVTAQNAQGGGALLRLRLLPSP